MTKRGIILGLLCVVFINAFCYFHDCVMNASAGIRFVPHLMPHVIYGCMLLAVLLLNPLLKRLSVPVLTRSEIALIVALSLLACSVPFYGMVHCWPSALMLPHHYNRIIPGWQREHVIDLVPPHMLTDPEADDGNALTGYVTGMGSGNDHISFFEVPWRVWLRPMLFWFPFVLSITIATLALAVVIHRQWAKHEQLPYPISRFASYLLPDDGPAMVRNRAFLVSAGFILGIHMINYCHAWWPEFFIPVRLRLDLSPLIKLAPEIIAGDGPSLFRPRIMFAVIGIAYFFASDVSFSLAVTPVVMCYIMGVLTGYGLSVTKGFSMFHNTKVFLYTGGYFGVFVMLIYTGRHFYWNVLKRSAGLRSGEECDRYLVVAMRVFLAGLLVFFVLLCSVGLDWLLALAYSFITVMVFTVISRAIAEAGGFYVGTWIMPGAVLWGFMGAQALGPTVLATIILLSAVLLVGPGWAPMPFAVQSLKLADMGDVPTSKIGIWCGVTLVLAMLVAIPSTIYWQSDQGVMTASSGWARYTPKLPFDQALKMKQQLEAQGVLAEAEAVRGFGRLAKLKPNATFVTTFVIGAGLAILVSFLRLRFAWWPLHPIAFVFFGSHQAQRLAFSFLLGWIIKTAISKYGGEAMYRKCVPVMVGLIAGEVLAGTIPIIVGTLYYVVTGERPVNCSLVL